MNLATLDTVNQSRNIERLISGQAVLEGAGVKVQRVIGQALHARLDPFLMLDVFQNEHPDDYIAGFPDHPHRGFETITYMLAGRLRHRDSAGNAGLLQSGGMQWMKAGRGVVHSEMPEQENGLMEGFQLWLNLPSADKLSDPEYRDVAAEQIPSFTLSSGVSVKIILGKSQGLTGAVTRPVTEALFLDVHLPANSQYQQALPPTHNAFVYVYRGAINIGDHEVPAGNMAILMNTPDSDGVILQANQPAQLLLIAGQPLHAPIVQHGPFVMNTSEQIAQAITDYRAGRLGA